MEWLGVRTPAALPCRMPSQDARQPLEIDLNADAGESYGPWRMGDDESLMPHLSSVNVACGAHAGDPTTMQRTIRLAAEHGVAVGAHPGFADREGFGRRDVALTPEELHTLILTQLGSLEALLRAEGRTLRHVKPHGALHHRMVHDAEAAEVVTTAIAAFDATLTFFALAGPAGEGMARAASSRGLRVVLEAFPDRGYLADGRLAPRGMEGALVADPKVMAARAVRIATRGEVDTLDGGVLPLEAHTLCLHGDGPHASTAARAIREALSEAGVTIRAP